MPLPIMWDVKGKDYLCKEQLVFFLLAAVVLGIDKLEWKICSMP